jgi:hypothetical protein
LLHVKHAWIPACNTASTSNVALVAGAAFAASREARRGPAVRAAPAARKKR